MSRHGFFEEKVKRSIFPEGADLTADKEGFVRVPIKGEPHASANALSFLSLRDLLKVWRYCRNRKLSLSIQAAISKKTGVEFNEFTDRMSELSDREAIRFVLDEVVTLDYAETMVPSGVLRMFGKDRVEALCQGLIKIEHLVTVNSEKIDCLSSEYGRQALRQGLITVQQAVDMELENLRCLLSESGVEALKRGLITVQQAADIAPEDAIYLSFSGGIEYLPARNVLDAEQVVAASSGPSL